MSTADDTKQQGWEKTADARGEVVWQVYDALGRRTELRVDSATGALRVKRKYDSKKQREKARAPRVTDPDLRGHIASIYNRSTRSARRSRRTTRPPR